MSREAWGDPPERQEPPQCCPVCDSEYHAEDCELGQEVGKRLAAEREVYRLRSDLENTRAEAILAVHAARADERERCAKLCEGMHPEDKPSDYAWTIRTEWAADSDEPNA